MTGPSNVLRGDRVRNVEHVGRDVLVTITLVEADNLVVDLNEGTIGELTALRVDHLNQPTCRTGDDVESLSGTS